MKEKTKKDIKIKEKISNFKINFGILAVILIIIFSVAITPITLQNDTYYTIKVGEHIANNGIDMKEPFAWHENLIYTYPHWLYDLITYFIYSIFGFTGIYVATCILSAILGVSIYFINKKINKNEIISFIVTLTTMFVMQPYVAARAQLITFILFIWTVFFIEKFLENKKKRYALALIIIPILISNLHAAVFPFYFVLYLPYIGEYVLVWLMDTILYKSISKVILKIKLKIATINKKQDKIDKLQEELKIFIEKESKIKIQREQDRKKTYKLIARKNENVKWLIVVMIICAFTGLITPIGDTPYTYTYKTMIGNTMNSISEHLPMTLINNTNMLCTIVIFLALLIFTRVKIRLCDFFMLAGLAYLTLKTRRQASMFWLVNGIVLNRLIVDLIKIYSKDFIEKLEDAFKNIFVGIFLTIFILIMSFCFVKPKLDDKIVSESSYPVKACDYILENIDFMNAKFYNGYNYGSYMLFRGIPVFIDSRADVYDPKFNGLEDDIFSDFINTSSINNYYGDTFEKYGITHVICSKNEKMNLIITKTNDQSLKELYVDDNFVIYERITNNINE